MKDDSQNNQRLLAEAEAKLRAEIIVYLGTCCNGQYECIENYIKEDMGRDTIIAMVFKMCSTGEGMAIQSALSLIDADLCSQ